MLIKMSWLGMLVSLGVFVVAGLFMMLIIDVCIKLITKVPVVRGEEFNDVEKKDN